MKSERIMKSKVYLFFDYILRLIILNALIIIPSFSIFLIYAIIKRDQLDVFTSLTTGNNYLVFLTFIPTVLWLFPSICASTDVVRQYENKETNTIFKDFFKSFIRLYIKSFVLSLFIFILGILLLNSIVFFFNHAQGSTFYLICLILSLSFSAAFVLVASQIPLVISYFKKITIIDAIKLSFIMAFKYLSINIVVMIIINICLGLSLLNNFVMAFGGLTLPIYFMVKLTFKNYIKIYRKVEE